MCLRILTRQHPPGDETPIPLHIEPIDVDIPKEVTQPSRQLPIAPIPHRLLRQHHPG
jgi:hypothetical protein